MNMQKENRNAKLTDMTISYYSKEQILKVLCITYLIDYVYVIYQPDVDTFKLEGIYRILFCRLIIGNDVDTFKLEGIYRLFRRSFLITIDVDTFKLEGIYRCR